MDVAQLGLFAQEVLLKAFRTHYQHFQTEVANVVQSDVDVIVILQLGDDLNKFTQIVTGTSS